ncbi:MAG TPA: hypothetical protein VHV10_17710 [Ktedonobacteraceae bacterium]|nr:hypothetical protein [Ktedonobacteraceae bacterium]
MMKMDLWAALNGDVFPPGTEEQRHATVPRGKRRLTERAILPLLRGWLLQYYVHSYCCSLAATRIFRRCYWIDTLGTDAKSSAATPTNVESTPVPSSGKGRKKGSVQLVPPALQPIITLSRELMQESKPITLYGLLLATKRKEIRIPQVSQNGNSTTPQIAIPKTSSMIHATWLEAAPSLLNETGQSPAIFLLNPLSPTLFSADDLAPLYQRAVPTELCLLISNKQVADHLLAASTMPTQATALSTLLRTDRWRTLPTIPEEQEQAIRGFIDLLIASLQRHFQLPIQPITFPIMMGPATVEPAPYTLLFATRRQDSLNCMNDAICTYRQKVEQESYRGVLGEEWFTSQQQTRQEQALQQLQQRICQQGQVQRTRRWPDLRQHLLLAQFGQFTLHDYNASIQQLLRNGEVRCTWRQPPVSPGEERIPGNDDTLVWQL